MTDKRNTPLVTRFDDVYNRPDCRAYYYAMNAVQYRNADLAMQGMAPALNELKRIRGIEEPCVVDFASGYGIGALLLRHHITLDQVLDRYQEPKFIDATVDEVIKWDSQWIDQNKFVDVPCQIFGLDVAEQALMYGKSVGIYDDIFAIDLQSDPASEELRQVIERCDLIIEVGSMMHLLQGTLQTMLDLAGDSLPWIVCSPVRGNESEECWDIMEEAGLIVEAMPIPPFPHRIFADDEEKQRAIQLVRERGREVQGFETTGSYHAQLYIARPEHECTHMSDWLG